MDLTEEKPDEHQDSASEVQDSKFKVPPIVVYSYIQNHMKTMNEFRKKSSDDVRVRSKEDRLIICAKKI